MLEKEIRSEIGNIKQKMKSVRACLGNVPLDSYDDTKWKKHLATLVDDVKYINKKINDYNLLVPLLNKQMVHVDLNRLALRILHEEPTRSDNKC